MSNKYTNLNDLFTAIADAIRRKTDSIAAIKADDFALEIDNVEMGIEYANEHITAIPDYMFYNCDQLKSIDCPNVETIGISAFENCIRLKEATISPTTQQIGANAFKGCLNTVIYADMTEIPEGWDEQWNPDNCPILGSQIAQWDISSTTDDSVTATLYNNILMAETYVLKLTGRGAMRSYAGDLPLMPWYGYKDKISRITIDNGITFISEAAFADCTMIESIILPNTVTDLGIGVFEGCTNLSKIEVSTQMLRIPERTFKNCTSLNNVVLPDSMTHFEYNSFQGCTSLDTIHLPAKLESIGSYVFEGCSAFTEFVIPSTVTGLGRWTFANCTGLTHFEIPATVTGIKENLLDGCTGLQTAVVSSRLTGLPNTFCNCTNLEEVTLPNTITSLSNTFMNCTSLAKIIYPSTLPKWRQISFSTNWNKNTGDYIIECSNVTLQKDGSFSVDVSASSNDHVIAEVIANELPSGTYTLKFSGTGNMKYPNTGTDWLWYDIRTLISNVVISSGVTNIGGYACYGQSQLTTLEIADTVSTIGSSAFYGCSGLTTVALPGCITTDQSVFGNCSKLTSVQLPKCTVLGTSTFYHCGNLTSIDLPKCIKIQFNVFDSCSNLTSIDLPECTKIFDGAFTRCSKLASINLPKCTSIGSEAFAYCNNLTSLYLTSPTFCTLTDLDAFINTPINGYTTSSGGNYGIIYTPIDLLPTYTEDTKWKVYNQRFKPTTDFYIIPLTLNGWNLINSTDHVSTHICMAESETNLPNVTITSNNTSIADISNITITETYLSFDIITYDTEGEVTFTVEATNGNYTQTFTLNTSVVAEIPYQYSVEAVNGASYGFRLNSNEYYESQNKGKDYSYALCKVNIKATIPTTMYVDCINYAETNYDYGLLSYLNNTLELNYNADSNVYYSFYGKSSSNVQTVTYDIPVGEHYIYVKFRKDQSVSNNNDSLQFKIRFEES